MGSGKTRETASHVSDTVKKGVNAVVVPRRKLAVNQKRSCSAIYGRKVFDKTLLGLIPDDTRAVFATVLAAAVASN